MIDVIVAIQNLTSEYTDHDLKYKLSMTSEQLSLTYTFRDSEGKISDSDGECGPNNEDTRGLVHMLISSMRKFYSKLPTKKENPDA
jgi:hypothetical protein